jgi:hypothetical protein
MAGRWLPSSSGCDGRRERSSPKGRLPESLVVSELLDLSSCRLAAD